MFVERVAQPVQHPALQQLAHRHAQGGAQGDDFAAGMNAVDFAQRHEQDMMIAKSHHLGQGGAVVAGGFDAANFADGDQRAFGLDDQPDQLDHAPVIAQHLGLLHLAEQVLEPVDRLDVRFSHHGRRLFSRGPIWFPAARPPSRNWFPPGSRRG